MCVRMRVCTMAACAAPPSERGAMITTPHLASGRAHTPSQAAPPVGGAASCHKAQLHSLVALDAVSQVSLSPRAAIPRPAGMPLLNLSLCNALENSTSSVAAAKNTARAGDDSDESTLSHSSRSGANSPEPLQKETSQPKLGGLQKETSQSKLSCH